MGKPAATGQLAAALERIARYGHEHAQDAERKRTGHLHSVRRGAAHDGRQLAGAASDAASPADRAVSGRNLRSTWDEVHEEAEHMEHAVSDRLVDRIDVYLGHPQVDPHGDPIPRADGSLETPASRTLAECQVGSQFRLARVVDQSPEFLRFLTESGLTLGALGAVLANRIEAGIVTVLVDGQQTALGREAAEKIFVTSRGEE